MLVTALESTVSGDQAVAANALSELTVHGQFLLG